MTATSRSNVLDFNPPVSTGVNAAINAALDAAAAIEAAEERRTYLGASSIGSDCLRKVQFDWQRVSTHAARTKRIFNRGHASEEKIAAQLALAGFVLERGTEATGFSAVDGMFKGHCDGIIRSGPEIEGLAYPCLWENKCLGSAGFNKIIKHGLRVAYPVYYDQIQLYQAYLGLDENPGLFTVEAADTCHFLALTVPFDADAAQAASDRAVKIIQATQAGELLPRITDKGPTDWRCKMCSHSEFCWSLET
jgi:hypothetical protein